MSTGRRRSVVALCLVLAACAVFLPVGLAGAIWVELVPFGLVVTLIAVTTIARIASRCDEQRVSLLSLVLFRAPPASL